MLSFLLTFVEVMALLLFLGASIYVSFFHKRNNSQPRYYGKRKVSFKREGVETISQGM